MYLLLLLTPVESLLYNVYVYNMTVKCSYAI